MHHNFGIMAVNTEKAKEQEKMHSETYVLAIAKREDAPWLDSAVAEVEVNNEMDSNAHA